MTPERRIDVPILARVEGEGALHLRIEGGRVTDAHLQIYEPPRFFEGLLRGRPYDDPVDITSRICGICPVAYQLTAARALEAAFGVDVDPEIDRLRRLLYCGEWIESHLLHIALLHAPDFLGYDDGIAMARDHRFEVETALAVKRIGNRIIEVLGGRAIHPVNVRVGGFHRVPTRDELAVLAPELAWAAGAMADLVRWTATFSFPDFEQTQDQVALRDPDAYAIERGRVVGSDGLDVAVGHFPDHFVEEQVAHSSALHSRTVDGRVYCVGPLARYNLNGAQLSAPVRSLADEVGLAPVCRNPFKSIVVRGLEALYALEEASAIVEDYRAPARPHVEIRPRAGVGHGATEAPRGLLYQGYEVADDGTIVTARIVPPTAQNQAAMEADVAAFAQRNLALADEDLQLRCEQVIRNYDPCISCSTHFLRLTVDRR